MPEARRAVIIGINDYVHPRLENLEGAARDAREVRDALVDQGGFLVDGDHLLIDGEATGERIRAAASDLFWKTDKHDIALFYFAGHGCVDHLRNGYLLPSDVDYEAPFVRGIRIQELKELLLHSTLKKTAIMILDCCYSGIATKAERAPPDADEDIDSFRKETELDSVGSGRFILASADSDKKAREVELQHALTGEQHVHGLFSFHLIEALRGSPMDTFGRVSLRAAVQHINEALRAQDKQKLKLQTPDESDADAIYLTIAHEILARERQKKLDGIRHLIEDGRPKPIFAAIRDIHDMDIQGLRCLELEEHCRCVDGKLKESHRVIHDWWYKHQINVLLACHSRDRGNEWFDRLNDMIEGAWEFESFKRFENKEFAFLSTVIDCIMKGESANKVADIISRLDRDSETIVAAASVNVRGLPTRRGTRRDVE